MSFPAWISTSRQCAATVDDPPPGGSSGGGLLGGLPGGVGLPGGAPPCLGGVRPGFPPLFPRPTVGCAFGGLRGVSVPGCGDGVTAGGDDDGGGVVGGLPACGAAGEWTGGAPMTAGGRGC